MLDGFVPYPPELAQRYRERGYWRDQTLAQEFAAVFGKFAERTPLKRCVTADDVAETMLNLLTANRFVTGEIVVIDGGFTSST
jgi:3-oxoacyl-[acyl-carrier protein] reductase